MAAHACGTIRTFGRWGLRAGREPTSVFLGPLATPFSLRDVTQVLLGGIFLPIALLRLDFALYRGSHGWWITAIGVAFGIWNLWQTRSAWWIKPAVVATYAVLTTVVMVWLGFGWTCDVLGHCL